MTPQETIRKALEHAIEDHQQVFDCEPAACPNAKELENSLAALEEMREDGERLDWLESKRTREQVWECHHKRQSTTFVLGTYNGCCVERDGDVRSAIDAARKSGAQGGDALCPAETKVQPEGRSDAPVPAAGARCPHGIAGGVGCMVCDTDGRAEAYAPEAHAEAVAAERQGAGTTASECPRCCTNLQRNTIKKLTAERDDWKAQAEEHLAFFQDEQRQLEAMRLECDDAIRTRNLAQEASTRDLEAKRVAEAASVRDLETIRIRGECPRHHPLDDRYGPLVCKQCADGVNAKLRADLEAANQRADEAIKQRDDWCFCLHATAEQKIKALAEVLRKEVPHAD